MTHRRHWRDIKYSVASLLFGGSRAERLRWQRAQLGEFEWWRAIATRGFNGRTRDEFLALAQREWLLSHLAVLEKQPDAWKRGTVVEFGSGPAGFVEYIDAARKIAIEPLIDRYRQVFPHLAASTVEYWSCPAEDIGHTLDGSADLVICFNVLDHTRDPRQVVENLARVAKTGADLLFQLNVYSSPAEMQKKPRKHAELHPHSLDADTVLRLLRRHRFDIRRQRLSDEADHNGEHFFICAGVKT